MPKKRFAARKTDAKPVRRAAERKLGSVVRKPKSVKMHLDKRVARDAEIVRLRKSGMPWPEIIEQIKEKYGVDLSYNTIHKIFRRHETDATARYEDISLRNAKIWELRSFGMSRSEIGKRIKDPEGKPLTIGG